MLVIGLIYSVELIPVLPLFVGLSVSQGVRFMPMQALSSRIPGSHERAHFMSAQASAQCLAQTLDLILALAAPFSGLDHGSCTDGHGRRRDRGVRSRAGEFVQSSISSANRDERVFVDPNKLDLTRTANPHIAFGIGHITVWGRSWAGWRRR